MSADRSKKTVLFVSLLAFLVALGFAVRVEAAVSEMLETFFTAEELKEDYFSDQMLAEISVAELERVREDFTDGLGEYIGAELIKEYTYEVYFEDGIVEVQMVVNKAGEIAGLYFISTREREADLEETIKEFKELSGKVSLLITKDGEELAALNPEQKMSVGSTFKLAVLKALREEIEAEALNWDDVIKLEEKARSLPSGRLQEWPTEAPLTVHTLASLMISESDNTATDLLINYLGKEKIEEQTIVEPPLLKTKEFFILHVSENQDLRTAYQQAEEEGKRELLSQVKDHSLPSVGSIGGGKIEDIGWYFSSYELKELMEEVRDLELMEINPGVTEPRTGERIAYKGGAQPGVLNYTTWLETEDNNQYFITATWNDGGVLEEDSFQRLYRQIINIIREQ